MSSGKARRWAVDICRAGAGSAMGALLLTVLLGACSSGSASGSCNENPSLCGTGQTCWVKGCSCPTNGNASTSCTPLACTEFDFECLPSAPSVLPGQTCMNQLLTPTCGDGQACVQEMNVNDGYGTCESYCDPTVAGSCPSGFNCVEVGVGLTKGSPVIHVCQAPTPDGGFSESLDGGGSPPVGDGGGITDATHVIREDVLVR